MFDFLKIGGAVKKLASELNDIRAAIETITQKIEDIAYAPKHPDDILGDAVKMLQRHEEKYKALFSERVFSQFAEPPKAQSESDFFLEMGRVSLTMGGAESTLLSLIGTDRILVLFKEEVSKMQPGEYGARRVERGPQLVRLQAELEKLRTAEKKLIAGAQDAGLVIQ